MGNSCNCESLSPHEQILQKQQHLSKQIYAISSSVQRQKYCKQLAQLKINQAVVMYNQLYFRKYKINSILFASVDTQDGQHLKISSHRSSNKSESEILSRSSQSYKNYLPLKDLSAFLTQQQFSDTLQEQCTKIGQNAIKRQEMAVVILHGKLQNSLNFNKPLGTYDIGLDSALTIFQVMFAKLSRLSQMCFGNEKKGNKIKVYILTNIQNKKQIISFFKQNKYLNYGCENIFFFSQETFPVMNTDGQILLKSETQIMTAPSGNGLVFWEMHNKKLLDHIQLQGAKYLFIGPIDNILMKIGDPKILGYLVKTKKQLVCTCFNKQQVQDSTQSMGYFGRDENGRVKIYENLCKMPEQSKYINTGSCVVAVDFIKQAMKSQKLQRSFEKNRHIINRSRQCYNPQSMKYEMHNCLYFQFYYHDILEFTNNVGVIEVEYHEQFCPIKAPQQSMYFSPKHARQSIWRLHRKWAQKAGYLCSGDGHIQFSPYISFSGQGIQDKLMMQTNSKNLVLPAYFS